MDFRLYYRAERDAHRIRGVAPHSRHIIEKSEVYEVVGELRTQGKAGVLPIRTMGAVAGVDEDMVETFQAPLAHFAMSTLPDTLLRRHTRDAARMLAGFEQVSVSLYMILHANQYSIIAVPSTSDLSLYKGHLVFDGVEMGETYKSLAFSGTAIVPRFALNPSIPTMFPVRKQAVIDLRPVQG